MNAQVAPENKRQAAQIRESWWSAIKRLMNSKGGMDFVHAAQTIVLCAMVGAGVYSYTTKQKDLVFSRIYDSLTSQILTAEYDNRCLALVGLAQHSADWLIPPWCLAALPRIRTAPPPVVLPLEQAIRDAR